MTVGCFATIPATSSRVINTQAAAAAAATANDDVLYWMVGSFSLS